MVVLRVLGELDAVARSRQVDRRRSRRSSPPGRWSSSRCGRTSSTASSTSCVTITTVLPVVCDDLHQLVLQPARASARRARRTARPAAAPSAPSRARGRCRRAASCRRRSRAGSLCSACVRPTSSSASRVRALQLGLRLARAEHALDREVDVVEAREPRQQRMVLEHDAALRARARDLASGAQQHAGWSARAAPRPD